MIFMVSRPVNKMSVKKKILNDTIKGISNLVDHYDRGEIIDMLINRLTKKQVAGVLQRCKKRFPHDYYIVAVENELIEEE